VCGGAATVGGLTAARSVRCRHSLGTKQPGPLPPWSGNSNGPYRLGLEIFLYEDTDVSFFSKKTAEIVFLEHSITQTLTPMNIRRHILSL
jgi:hypothetical protein